MSKDRSRPAPVAHRKQGQYSDGHPLDEVQYLECKLILKPDRFTAAKVFLDYGKLVAKTAKEFGIGFSNKGVVLKPAIREVVFLDIVDFRLYNNAFILRQRIAYESGFPAGEPEIVFKFRHEDMQKAAVLDVRPKFAGNYRIKFKAEALPLRDQVGGYRLLFSHNAQFSLSQAPEGDRESMGTLARVFPALEALKTSDADRIELVNQTIVEEVLQDLGVLDFGKGITADSNVSIWRERGTHHPLCGEFAFQACIALFGPLSVRCFRLCPRRRRRQAFPVDRPCLHRGAADCPCPKGVRLHHPRPSPTTSMSPLTTSSPASRTATTIRRRRHKSRPRKSASRISTRS